MTFSPASWRSRTCLTVAVMALLGSSAPAATYTYKDESGTFHMVSDPNQVPARFRSGAKRYEDGPAPRAATSAPAPGTDLAAATAAAVPANAAPSPTVIKSKSFANGHVVVDAKLDRNVFQPMMVDTGATITNISIDTAKHLGVSSSTPLSFMVAETANGAVILPVIRVSSITVGDATVEDLPVVVNPFLGEDGLLGIDFLGHFTSQVDAGMQTLTLAPLDTTPRPGLYGGHPEEWWKARYAMLTTAVVTMRDAREAVSRELSSPKYAHVVGRSGRKIESPKEATEVLDGAVKFWQEELRALQIDASEAHLPHGLR